MENISKELTEIRNLMLEFHADSGFQIQPNWGWLQSLPYFDECGCKLCQAMHKITVLEVNLSGA